MKLSTLALPAIALLALGFGPSPQDPARLPGEPKLAEKAESGWATITFPDLGITVDLPAWPTAAEMEWEEEDGESIKSWSGYDFESLKIGGDLYVYEPQKDVEFSAEDLLEQEIETYEDERQYTRVKMEKGEFTEGSDKVLTLSVTFLEGIDDAVGRCFFWKNGDKVGMLRLSWWAEDDRAGKEAADHIQKSLRIE